MPASPSLIRDPVKAEFILWTFMNPPRCLHSMRSSWRLQSRFPLKVLQVFLFQYCLFFFFFLKQICFLLSLFFFPLSILFIWTTFFSFLFDFITDANYKQHQWFRSSWKQNTKGCKTHAAYAVNICFIILSVRSEVFDHA